MTRSNSEFVRVRPAVIDAHRADGADPADIQRAYLRFSWSRRKSPPILSVSRWLVAGFAIGLGVASAATLLPKLTIRSSSPNESGKAVAPVARQRPLGVAARSSGVKEEPLLEEAVSATSAQPTAALPAGSASGRPSVATQRSPPPANAALAASASDWQRAAAALRNGDLSVAEAALANLEKSDTLLERQAAELARAQLQVRRGQGAEATSTLQRLAREGGSAVIRSQAANTLRTLSD